MPKASTYAPDMLPVLSRGKHRNPRRGACFMELASVLAGERWSDHPRCTHPLLAELARLVNDHTPDEHRSALAPLIPSVIETNTPDERVDALIAWRAARTALPLVSAERQNVMAISVRTADRMLSKLDGRSPDDLLPASRETLDQVPVAAEWADRRIADVGFSLNGFRKHAAPNTVRIAVEGIARACMPTPHVVLRELLQGAISDCSPTRRPAVAPPLAAPVTRHR